MNGGIYNAALFGASQREARGKLEQMAGIKRPPNGILASSPELMQAASAMPARPQPMPMPMAQPMPATMPMVQPALPQVPMQTTVAPMQQAPAPRPTAPAPQPQQQPTMMQEGGPVDVRKAPTASDPASAFVDTVNALGAGIYDSLLKRYGSPEKTEQAVVGQVNAVQAAVDSGSAENAANTVIDQAGLPVNDESKKEFASTVLNLDTDDIGEIDDAIFRTLTADVTLSGKELQKAVLLGLQNYKQTASARAAAVSGAKASTYTPERLFQQAVEKIMGNPEQFDVYNDEGSAVDPMKVRREAMKIAQATSTAMTGDSGDNRMVAYDASGKPFYSTDGVNYVDAQGNPYVPPKE